LGYIFKDFCFCCCCVDVFIIYSSLYIKIIQKLKNNFLKKIAKQCNAKQAIKVYPLKKRSGVQFKPIFRPRLFAGK